MTIKPEQLTIWTFLDRVVADPVAANTIDLSNWIGSLDIASIRQDGLSRQHW